MSAVKVLDNLWLNSAGTNAPALVLAHGAGAPMDSEFMNAYSAALVACGVSVYRFEFAYMRERRLTGKKRPPSRLPQLLADWHEALARARRHHGTTTALAIGGKSMGGRIAAHLAHREQVAALVCIGYPFHPPAKPATLRLAALQAVTAPSLVLQGDRDKLGNATEVGTYDLPRNIQLAWLEDGDHDLKPRMRSGFSHSQHIKTAARLSADFIFTLG